MEKSRRKQEKYRSRGSCSACIDRDNGHICYALYYLLNIIYRIFHVNLPWELRFHRRPIETFPPRGIIIHFICFAVDVLVVVFLINCAAAISQFQQTSSLLGLYIFYICTWTLWIRKQLCEWTRRQNSKFHDIWRHRNLFILFCEFFHDKILFFSLHIAEYYLKKSIKFQLDRTTNIEFIKETAEAFVTRYFYYGEL